MNYLKTLDTQEKISQFLSGKKISKLYFAEADSMKLTAILFERGELLTLDPTASLSHPEYEEELTGMREALDNLANSGRASFKAKYLSSSEVDAAIKNKAMDLKSGSWGRVPDSTRQDYVTYTFTE